MSIDTNLNASDFPLPAIREVNLAKSKSSISLGLGELKNFPVDKLILDVLKSFSGLDAVSYSANAGYLPLRNAVAEQQISEDGFSYTSENVLITIGVQNAMYTSIKTLAKLGVKRVLIPEINFGIYKKIPKEFDLEVLTYQLTSDFRIDLEFLDSLLLPDDVVILNSPSNPTGRVFLDNELEKIGALLKRKLTQGYVISDEIYKALIYDGEKPKSFSKYFDRTLVLSGVSKSGAIAGLRVGWIISRNKKLVKALVSNNATIISCPPTLNQMAAIPIVKGLTHGTIADYNKVLKTNRDAVCSVLDRLNIPYVKPMGSFYIFPKIDQIVGNEIKKFCIDTAQQENGVVVIPGSAFGAEDYIRISLASSDIEEGMNRLEKAFNSFKKRNN